MNNTTQELSKKEQYLKDYYLRNREKICARSKHYHTCNKEKYKEKAKKNSKRWYENNKEKIKLWQKENKERISKRCKKYYLERKAITEVRAKNKIINRNSARKYVEKNKHTLAYRLAVKRNARKQFLKNKNEPKYKIARSIRRRVHEAFKKCYVRKSVKLEILIGCTVEQARQHIESLWLPGMTWENYNLYTWHIDHIKPVNTFDLTDPEQQKLCFHYTNLRPLWASDNLRRPKDGSDVI